MNNNKKFWWSSGCGRLEFELPADCINDCSHSGKCDDDVEFWQQKIELPSTRDHWIETLEGCGAWYLKDLIQMTDIELQQKIIWLAACDIADSTEFLEYEGESK